MAWVEHDGPVELRDELRAFREGRTPGSWDNFLYFVAREFHAARPDETASAGRRGRRGHHAPRLVPRRCGSPRRSCRSPGWTRARFDARLGDVDADRLRASRAVIVNVDYPLGLAAYNILREITEDRDTLAGLYVLGKAATLNADVGDVMISSVSSTSTRGRRTGSTTPSASRTSRPTCASAPGWTTSAR